MTSMLEVKVLFFATLREKAGVKESCFQVADGSLLRDLKIAVMDKFPQVKPYLPTCVISQNKQFAFDEDSILPDSEVAFFPPVSGGQEKFATIIKITNDEINVDHLINQLTLPTTGAICIFTGIVRGQTEQEIHQRTEYLEYEAYIPMAEVKLHQIADEIRERWPFVEGIALVQRIGVLYAGTPTVLIACTGSHRNEGVFEASRYGIDRLKEIVPVWKKEVGPDGQTWVEGEFFPGRED